MPVLIEPKYLSDWLWDEFSAPRYCREEVSVLADSQRLVTGTVLGIIPPGVYVPFDATASDGREVPAAFLITDLLPRATPHPAVVLLRGPALVIEKGLTWHPNNQPQHIDAALAHFAALSLPIIAR